MSYTEKNEYLNHAVQSLSAADSRSFNNYLIGGAMMYIKFDKWQILVDMASDLVKEAQNRRAAEKKEVYETNSSEV